MTAVAGESGRGRSGASTWSDHGVIDVRFDDERRQHEPMLRRRDRDDADERDCHAGLLRARQPLVQ
ncbi:MAG TPA: hypothetical protein VGF66_10300, partial [Gaiellaceae bacterium]